MFPNLFSKVEYPQYKLVHKSQPPLNLPTMGTKIKHVLAQWIALLHIENGRCSLTFAKVIKPNNNKTATKSSYIIHPQINEILLPIRSQK